MLTRGSIAATRSSAGAHRRPRGRGALVRAMIWAAVAPTATSACERSPSRASPVESSSVAAETMAQAPTGSPAPPPAAPSCRRGAQRDLAYRTGPASQPIHRLDLHVPESGHDLPLVVYVHGGAWREGDKARVFDKPAFFNREGFVFASVGYRLSTEGSGVTHPMHASDVAAAVAWLEEKASDYCADKSRMVAMGHSAGGQIVATIASDVRHLRDAGASSSALRCAMINDTEGFDLPRLFEKRKSGWTREIYENAFTSDDAILRDASPIRHLAAHPALPQFLLVTRGGAERRGQVGDFAAKARAVGGIAFVHDAQERDHVEIDRDLGTDGDAIGSTTVRFYRRCLGMDRPFAPR